MADETKAEKETKGNEAARDGAGAPAKEAAAAKDEPRRVGRMPAFSKLGYLILGAVVLFEAARNEGDVLVVGINSDASVRRLWKGEARPVMPEMARARVVAGFAAVDCVVLFDEDTPYELIQALEPDVLVKGGDYSRATTVGADIVEARGGRVKHVELVDGFSTTNIVERLRGTT